MSDNDPILKQSNYKVHIEEMRNLKQDCYSIIIFSQDKKPLPYEVFLQALAAYYNKQQTEIDAINRAKSSPIMGKA